METESTEAAVVQTAVVETAAGNAIDCPDSAYQKAGATILPGISIGADAVIGAGALVTRDVKPETTTVVGVPARVRAGP